MSRYFVALDAGCKEINAVAARWNKNGDYIIEGFIRSGSSGISKGVVTDAAKAADSIREAIDKLKEKTGKRIRDVYVGISSSSVNISPSTGTLLLSKYGREITENDINDCVEIGSAIKLPLDKEPLHKIISGFSIDGEREIKNPLNLEGVKLGVNVNVVTVSTSALRNLEKCIIQAGFIPEGFVFAGLAASYRVLTEEDKQKGAVLLDVCKDFTEVMVFHKDILRGCKVVKVGADELLLEDGSVDHASLEKLVSGVMSLPGRERATRVVVIGEGALSHNVIEALERELAYPVKAGTCITKPLEDLPPERTGYIGSLGILDHFQEEKHRQRQYGNLLRRGFNRMLGFVDRYF